MFLFVYPRRFLNNFILSSLRIFISAFVPPLAATSALSSLCYYPSGHYHYVPSSGLTAQLKSSRDGGVEGVWFHATKICHRSLSCFSLSLSHTHYSSPLLFNFSFCLFFSFLIFSWCDSYRLPIFTAFFILLLLASLPLFWSIFFLVCWVFTLLSTTLSVFTWLFSSLLSCLSSSSLSPLGQGASWDHPAGES